MTSHKLKKTKLLATERTSPLVTSEEHIPVPLFFFVRINYSLLIVRLGTANKPFLENSALLHD